MWCFTKQKGVLGTQMHKIANFKCPKEHEISVEMLSFYVSCFVLCRSTFQTTKKKKMGF